MGYREETFVVDLGVFRQAEYRQRARIPVQDIAFEVAVEYAEAGRLLG